jgi:hypothetical protein
MRPRFGGLKKTVLIYMSIRDQIAARFDEGRLRQMVPTLPHDPVERHLFVSKEISDLVDGPWADAEWEVRCNRLRMDFDVFIRGDVITVAEQCYKAQTAYMARLFPGHDEVWEIRSRDPKPSLRIFGRFTEEDVFVALTWSDRKSLGPKGSPEWAKAIRACKAEWRKCFPAYEPMSGKMLDEYATNSVLI